VLAAVAAFKEGRASPVSILSHMYTSIRQQRQQQEEQQRQAVQRASEATHAGPHSSNGGRCSASRVPSAVQQLLAAAASAAAAADKPEPAGAQPPLQRHLHQQGQQQQHGASPLTSSSGHNCSSSSMGEVGADSMHASRSHSPAAPAPEGCLQGDEAALAQAVLAIAAVCIICYLFQPHFPFQVLRHKGMQTPDEAFQHMTAALGIPVQQVQKVCSIASLHQQLRSPSLRQQQELLDKMAGILAAAAQPGCAASAAAAAAAPPAAAAAAGGGAAGLGSCTGHPQQPEVWAAASGSSSSTMAHEAAGAASSAAESLLSTLGEPELHQQLADLCQQLSLVFRVNTWCHAIQHAHTIGALTIRQLASMMVVLAPAPPLPSAWARYMLVQVQAGVPWALAAAGLGPSPKCPTPTPQPMPYHPPQPQQQQQQAGAPFARAGVGQHPGSSSYEVPAGYAGPGLNAWRPPAPPMPPPGIASSKLFGSPAGAALPTAPCRSEPVAPGAAAGSQWRAPPNGAPVVGYVVPDSCHQLRSAQGPAQVQLQQGWGAQRLAGGGSLLHPQQPPQRQHQAQPGPPRPPQPRQTQAPPARVRPSAVGSDQLLTQALLQVCESVLQPDAGMDDTTECMLDAFFAWATEGDAADNV
jgi:hypothetical protein